MPVDIAELRKHGVSWPWEMPPGLSEVVKELPPEKQRQFREAVWFLSRTAHEAFAAFAAKYGYPDWDRSVLSVAQSKRLKGAETNRVRKETWEAALLNAQLALPLSLRRESKHVQLAEIRNPHGPHAAAVRKCLVGIKLPADRWCLPVLRPRLKK